MQDSPTQESDAARETLNFWARQTSLLGDREPLEVLDATPVLLGHLLRDLPGEVLQAHPLPGKWSIHEIVLHLADMEWVFGFRLRTILGDDDPAMMPVDQEAWAAKLAAEKRTTSLCLRAFGMLRELNLQLWHELSPQDLERCGLHHETGVRLSLRRMRNIQAGHDLSHLAQIEERLQLLQISG